MNPIQVSEKGVQSFTEVEKGTAVRRRLSQICLGWGTVLLLAGVAPFVLAGPKPSSGPRLVSLRLDPGAITLEGSLAKQRLLVTGRYSDGNETDVTAQAKIKLAKPGIAHLNADGTL